MYSCEIVKIFSDGVKLYNEEITLNLLVLKRLHAELMVGLYNFLTLDQGQVIINNGSRSAGICQALTIGVIRLQPLNLCALLDLLISLCDQVYNPPPFTE